MILHIGEEVTISVEHLVALLKYDVVQYKINKEFIAGNDAMIVRISKDNPKSILVVSDPDQVRIYLSPISAATLFKRLSHMIKGSPFDLPGS